MYTTRVEKICFIKTKKSLKCFKLDLNNLRTKVVMKLFLKKVYFNKNLF